MRIDRSALHRYFATASSFARQYDIAITFNLFIFGLCLICLSRIQPIIVTKLADLLYGDNIATSLGCLMLAASPVFYLSNFLRRRGVDWFAVIVFICAAIISLHYIHISNNTAYTNDWRAHWDRIQYITNHWLEPYGYWDEGHHPPLYYYAAAIFLRVSNEIGTIPTITAVRTVSWIAYLVFNVYSLLILRHAGLTGMVYRASAIMLVFWPAGFHLASKIAPDAFYYAFYAPTFYYVVRWYQAGNRSDLMKALILAGITFTARTNAIILFIIIGVLVLVALYRRRLEVTEFLTRPWIMAGVFVLLCIVTNFWRMIWHGESIEGHIAAPRQGALNFSRYLYVSFDYAQKPFNDFSAGQSFWDFVFKTSMFGEYGWPSPQLAILLSFLLHAIFWYTVLPWLFAARSHWRNMLPHGLNALIPVIFVILYSMHANTFSSQDARYIYPSVISFVIFFGKSYEMYKARGALVLTWLGPILAFSFALVSAYFFWNNAR